MQIDNYQEATQLTEKMEASLPIKAYPTKEMIKGLKIKGKAISSDRVFEMTDVKYSGDMGGIMCILDATSKDKEVLVASITHLKIDPDHPLAAEIQAYQRKRTQKLALQNSWGFASEMIKEQSSQTSKKRKAKGKGFGQ